MIELIEGRFRNSSSAEVEEARDRQKRLIYAAKGANMQAKIDLMNAIDVIAASATKRVDTRLHNIRSTRKLEKRRTHKDYMSGGEQNDL